MKKFFFPVLLFFFLCDTSLAATLLFEGSVKSTAVVAHKRTFRVPSAGLDSLTFRFANPSDLSTPTVAQKVTDHWLEYYPAPKEVRPHEDSFGNRYTVASWANVVQNVTVMERYTAHLDVTAGDADSSAPFPFEPGAVTPEVKRFLVPTALVQSDDAKVRELAASLTEGAGTELAAVRSILNWVADHVKYRPTVPAHDAAWTLVIGRGSCQNYSHLSLALLRASGIPARIAGGVYLGTPWKVPMEKGHLVEELSSGSHLWVEVWYPDLGWMPYDVLQSYLFVGPRYVRLANGLDASDVNDSWDSSPEFVPFGETVAVQLKKEKTDLKLTARLPGPVPYILSAARSAPQASAPGAAEGGKEGTEDYGDVKPGGKASFGNLGFEKSVALYVRTKGNAGQKTFEHETSAYATGVVTYAQAFTVPTDMWIDQLSLAMKKGGKAGTLWADIVQDSDGRPGNKGYRSLPLSLDKVSYSPGFKWFKFRFARTASKSPLLPAGRYWIVLRHTKYANVNWFFTPGGQWGAADDTLSQKEGNTWPCVMNYDFVFRVEGLFAPSK